MLCAIGAVQMTVYIYIYWWTENLGELRNVFENVKEMSKRVICLA